MARPTIGGFGPTFRRPTPTATSPTTTVTATISTAGLMDRTRRSAGRAAGHWGMARTVARAVPVVAVRGSVAVTAGRTSAVGRLGDRPERKVRANSRAAAAWAGQRQGAAGRGQAVRQPTQTRARGQVGAASAVIGDRDDKAAVLFGDRDPSLRRRRVSGHVRQRLGDDEVGRCLHLRVVSLIVDVDCDRERRPLGECIDGRGQAGLGEDGRVDPPREASDFADRGLELGRRLIEQLRLAGRALLGDLEPHGQGHEPLLGAVVEIALDPASFRVGRLDDPQPRRPDLLELGPDLGRQPLVLERQPGGVPDRFDEARILDLDRRVVDEDAEELVVTLESRDHA